MKKILYILKLIFWSKEKYAKKEGVTIGKNCWIATRQFGSEPYLITIGNHVQITENVRFFTHGGGWVLRNKYPSFDLFGKIKIGNNVYIGNSSLIMPGITVGNNVIIGAGSVITKSVPDGVIVAGNPARVIGTINDYERKILKYNLNSKGMNYNKKKKYLLSLEEDKFIKR